MGRKIASSPRLGGYRSRTSGGTTGVKRCVWVEELEKEEGILAMGEKVGMDRMVSALENLTRGGVKGGGAGDLQKGASEELEVSVPV